MTQDDENDEPVLSARYDSLESIAHTASRPACHDLDQFFEWTRINSFLRRCEH